MVKRHGVMVLTLFGLSHGSHFVRKETKKDTVDAGIDYKASIKSQVSNYVKRLRNGWTTIDINADSVMTGSKCFVSEVKKGEVQVWNPNGEGEEADHTWPGDMVGCQKACAAGGRSFFNWWEGKGACLCTDPPFIEEFHTDDREFSGATGAGSEPACTVDPPPPPAPPPALPPAPPPAPAWCSQCTDTANAEMGLETCSDWALTGRLYTKCKDGGNSWTSSKSCQWSCYEVGFGYADDKCCAHHETPESCEGQDLVPPGFACDRDADSARCSSDDWKRAGFCQCSCKKLRPHIIFMLIDDLGFDDFVTASDMQGAWRTTIGLMEETRQHNSTHGSILVNSSYCEAVCAPSRSSLMAGLWRHLIDDAYGWGGVSWRDEIALPLKMRIAGYKTYGIGKWHIGKAHWRHLPAGRGFHRYYGQTENGDQYAHCSKHAFGGRRRRTVAYDVQVTETEPGYTGTDCSPAAPHHEYDGSAVGKYSSELYTEKAVDMLMDHKRVYPRHPFFMYFAHYAIHSPYDAPKEDQSGLGTSDPNAQHWGPVAHRNYWANCADIVNEGRKAVCAMNTALDDSINNLTHVLQTHYADDNYVLIITADNGGSNWWGASSNAPLRSGKGEYWEGGIRHHVLVWGKHPDLDNAQAYTYTGGTMHLVDWHATVVALGHLGHPFIPITDAMAIGHSSGHNVWNAITTNTESPAPYVMSAGEPDRGMVWIEGDYKILLGAVKGRRSTHCNGNGRTRGPCLYGYLWPQPSNTWATESDWRAQAYNNMTQAKHIIGSQLFNLTDDPGESRDLLTNCPDSTHTCAEYQAVYDELKFKFDQLLDSSQYRHSQGLVDFFLQGATCGSTCLNVNCEALGQSEFNLAFPNGMPAHGCEVVDTVHFPCYGTWPGR